MTEHDEPTVTPTTGLAVDDDLARAAYAAYGSVTDGLNFRGEPMPDYDDLGPKIQAAWRAAAHRAAELAVGHYLAPVTTADAEGAAGTHAAAPGTRPGTQPGAEPDSRTWV